MIDQFMPNGGTNVYGSVRDAVDMETSKGFMPNRIVVFTDEQDNYYDINKVAVFAPRGYVVNVGTYKKGVFYQSASKWVHISGWSDGVVKFITENEKKS